MSEVKLYRLADFRKVTPKDIFVARLNNSSFHFTIGYSFQRQFFRFCVKNGFLRYIRTREHRGNLGEFIATDDFCFNVYPNYTPNKGRGDYNVRHGDLVNWTWSLMGSMQGAEPKVHYIFDTCTGQSNDELIEASSDISREFSAL